MELGRKEKDEGLLKIKISAFFVQESVIIPHILKVVKLLRAYMIIVMFLFSDIWACRSQHAMTKTEKYTKKQEGIQNEHKE